MGKSISDNIRICSCGSWNSPYRLTCGGCNNKLIINMDGVEIIERLKIIRKEKSNVNTNMITLQVNVNYLMYKNNSL